MNKLDQKEYLKRYLCSDDKLEKKKKKKIKDKNGRVSKKTLSIIDDDATSFIQNEDIESSDLYATNEEAPQIVGYTDERVGTIITKQEYEQSGKWKSLNNDKSAKESLHQLNKSVSQRRKYSDESPPRKRKNSDESPPRRRNSYKSPPRRSRNSDESPPRRRKNLEETPPRRRISDESPPRRRKNSDESPPRRRKNSDESPPRRRISDESPPRRRKNSDESPPRRRKNSDESPPRRRKNSDESPPRIRRNSKEKCSEKIKNRKSRFDRQVLPTQDSQIVIKKERLSLSPSNYYIRTSKSPEDVKRSIKREKDSCSPQRPIKMSKTLDGKASGLQNAKILKEENERFRQKQEKLFKDMKPEFSGRNAEITIRDNFRNKDFEHDVENERKKMREEAERKKEYDRWGKGLKQLEQIEKRRQEYAYESSKPLARSADDEDLQEYLKNKELTDDPMLQYMRRKRKEENLKKGIVDKPMYNGDFPDNRFNIRPGFRWDGVDRSNGYEKKYFSMINSKKSLEEEAYRYSTEDM